MDAKNVIIIGGGIVGLATALRMSQKFPWARIRILEKEAGVGRHQTGHNSGVLHCGLYYKPGSVKARLAVNGIRQMVEFCRENAIPHEICGKLVVATNAAEVERLRSLHERGIKNGLEGLAWMERAQMREIEPHVGGVAALRVPQEGIVDYPKVCDAMVAKLAAAGAEVVTGAHVHSIRREGSAWRAITSAGEYTGDFLITCAGLYSDRVAEMSGERRDMRIVPFRGEYYKLRPERQSLVRHLIYPVPDPQFPFLGVHFTRLIHGGIEAGPNAVLALAREGYRKTDFNAGDLFDALTYGGFWRFLRRYPSMCWYELRRSFSRELFCQSLQKLVPEIQPDDLAPGGSGVRAQAIAPEGELVQDFRLIARPNALHVLNAPSPAATASLAIGGEIVDMIAAG
jgi:L-2-hydroxyglutarate oxidase